MVIDDYLTPVIFFGSILNLIFAYVFSLKRNERTYKPIYLYCLRPEVVFFFIVATVFGYLVSEWAGFKTSMEALTVLSVGAALNWVGHIMFSLNTRHPYLRLLKVAPFLAVQIMFVVWCLTIKRMYGL